MDVGGRVIRLYPHRVRFGTPGADGLASSPTYYVQFWWLQLLRHLVKVILHDVNM